MGRMTQQGRTVDEIDKRILQELTRDPMATFAQLAARLGDEIGERTISRRYRRLERVGLVRVVGRTRPEFGGDIPWFIRIEGRAEHIERLAKQLTLEPRARWIRTTPVRNEMVVGLTTHSITGDPLLDMLAQDAEITRLQPHQLLRVWTKDATGNQGSDEPEITLDSLDRTILHHLSLDGRTPHRAIADATDVDPATISRRIRRLVDNDVLFYTAEIPQEVLDTPLDVLVWCKVEPGSIGKLGDYLHEQPRVVFVAATTGSANLVFNINTDSYTQTINLVDDLLADRGVTQVEIMVLGTMYKRLSSFED